MVPEILHVAAGPLLLTLALCGCSGGDDGAVGRLTPAGTVGPPPTSTVMPPNAVLTPSLSPTPSNPEEPLGFPIAPAQKLGLVVGTADSRAIQWGAGPEAMAYSRDDQTSDDPERANRSGWDCRVHVEYEGQPAVDWYVPVGIPIRATMVGTATLYIVTVTNAFDYYGVAREPYIGNPDRTRAPLSPFPGPGGGKGVFVRVENEGYVTEYAHLDVARTVAPLPASVFLSGYSPDYDYAGIFAPLRDFRVSTAIAQWTVNSGDVIGFSGDSGYSEAPHLHYTVGRFGAASLLCPTAEAGFADGGWLMKASALGGGCSNCPLY